MSFRDKAESDAEPKGLITADADQVQLGTRVATCKIFSVMNLLDNLSSKVLIIWPKYLTLSLPEAGWTEAMLSFMIT